MRLRKRCSSRKRWAHGGDGARERMWAREDLEKKLGSERKWG